MMPPPTRGPDARAVRIRRAQRTDVGALAALFERYRAFYGAPADPVRVERFLDARIDREESTVYLACDAAAEPVGFVQLYPSFSSLALRNTEVLNDLYVVPTRRRSGIATLLVAAALEHAVRRSAVAIELETQWANASARALYRKFGFRSDPEFARLRLALSTPPEPAPLSER